MRVFAETHSSNDSLLGKNFMTHSNLISRLKVLLQFSSNHVVIQRTPDFPCGGGCPRCKDNLSIQRKLKINESGDKYEQEAGRIADQVMRMTDDEVLSVSPTNSAIQRKCTECSNENSLCPECAEEKDGIQPMPVASTITSLIQRQSDEFEVDEEILEINETAPGQPPPQVNPQVAANVHVLKVQVTH